MSRLTQPEIQKQREYESILSGILSPTTTNDRIKQSEQLLKELEVKALPDLINCIIISLNAHAFTGLQFESATNPEYRQLSATILYRTLCKEKYDEVNCRMYHHWDKLPDFIRGRVLEGLINFIETENTSLIMNQVFYAAACLMKIIIESNGQWPQLYMLLSSFTPFSGDGRPIVTNDTALNILKAFKMYTQLANEVMNGMGQYTQNICALVNIFLELNPQDPRVEIDEEFLNDIKDEAFMTGTGILKYTSFDRRKGNNCDRMIVNMLCHTEYLGNKSLAEGGDGVEKHLAVALNSFIDVFWFRPREVKLIVRRLLGFLMAFISKTSRAQDIKKGLELLVSICDVGDEIFMEIPLLMENVLLVLIHFMVKIPDDPDWENCLTPEDDDVDELEDSDSLYLVAELHLHKLSHTNRYAIIKAICPPLNKFAQLLFSKRNVSWQHSYAALMVYADLWAASKNISYIQKYIADVCTFIQHPHPRVRWCAVNSLGQLCSLFKRAISIKDQQVILENLIKMTQDPVQRVSMHAIKCLTNFINIDDESDQAIESFKDPIIKALIAFLETHQTLYAQECGTRTLIVLIQALEKGFEPYYGIIMTYFRNIISNVTSQEGETLRGLIVEGASLAGKSVERDRFIGDGKFILEAMSRFNLLNPSNPVVKCVESALCTFAEILGEDFTSFMPNVIPYVLEQAAMEVQNQEVDKEDYEDQNAKTDYYYEGDKIILYSKSQADDKADSIHALGVYAHSTKANFLPYVERAFEIVVKETSFKFCDEVPMNSFYCMEHILRSAALAAIQNPSLDAWIREMLKKILEITTECIRNKENSWNVRVAAIKALRGAFLVMDSKLQLTEQVSERIAAILGGTLESWAKCIQEEDYEDCDDDFFYAYYPIQECIDVILKRNYRVFIQPYIRHIHKAVLSMVSLDMEEYPGISLRVLASVAHYMPPSQIIQPLFADILNAHLEMARSKESFVMQEACAGLETLIETHPKVIQPFYEKVSAAIMEVVSTTSNSTSQSYLAVHDVGIATLSILIYEYGPRQDSSDLKFFLSKIPLFHSKEAAVKAHKLFCVLSQTYYQRIIGQNNENAPIVVQIFAKIIQSGHVTQEINKDIMTIVRSLAETVNENVLISNLTPELLEIFRNFVRQNNVH